MGLPVLLVLCSSNRSLFSKIIIHVSLANWSHHISDSKKHGFSAVCGRDVSVATAFPSATYQGGDAFADHFGCSVCASFEGMKLWKF